MNCVYWKHLTFAKVITEITLHVVFGADFGNIIYAVCLYLALSMLILKRGVWYCLCLMLATVGS
jgi:hypothetical protein